MILMAEDSTEKIGAEDVADTEAAQPRRRRTAARVDTAVESAEEVTELAAKRRQSGKAGLNKQLVFGKYDPKDVVITDGSMADYVNLDSYIYPNIFGRRSKQSYYESHISVVERLINKLMRGGTGKKIGGKVVRTEGRLQGKKVTVMRIVKNAFDSVSKQTGKNPLQVLINALQNSAPIEDTTRVRYGGISYNVAVGISAQRRINVALKNIALAALIGAFKNKRSLSDALANELILAANNSPDSYAIKKRVEGERIAKRAR
jgi:small subunit ribosomal protein S7